MVPPALPGLRSLALVALGLPLLLSGCSGTPFGEALSRSFPDPAGRGGERMRPETPAPSPPAGSPSPLAPATGRPLPPGTSATRRPGAPGAPTGVANPTAPATPSPASPAPQRPAAARLQPSSPAPYRVTLRLPQADPAAPAEGLTEALRAAGVTFEVETIERLGGAAPTPSGAPTASSPAAAAPSAAAGAAAAQVRPAPAPR